jgi:CubicO group peptidase (beta-lactamase class C family)
VLDPAGLKDTHFDLTEADKARAMQGHNFGGSSVEGFDAMSKAVNELIAELAPR